MDPLMIAAALQYLDGRQKRSDMAEEGREGIAQQFAASTGFPMYGVQAAKTRDAMDEEGGASYIADILRMRAQRGG